jgi:hypothetical protein
LLKGVIFQIFFKNLKTYFYKLNQNIKLIERHWSLIFLNLVIKDRATRKKLSFCWYYENSWKIGHFFIFTEIWIAVVEIIACDVLSVYYSENMHIKLFHRSNIRHYNFRHESLHTNFRHVTFASFVSINIFNFRLKVSLSFRLIVAWFAKNMYIDTNVAKVIVFWQRSESYVAKVVVANMKRSESYSAQQCCPLYTWVHMCLCTHCVHNTRVHKHMCTQTHCVHDTCVHSMLCFLFVWLR